MVRWLRTSRPAWPEARVLVMDLEMTGLNAREDSIISAGWVVIDKGRIELSQAGYQYFQPTALMASDVADSAHIHLITDRQLEQEGQPLSLWLQRLHADLAADRWVFHHAPLDMAFLKVYSDRLDIALPSVPVEDTLVLEQKRFSELSLESQSQLSLNACRARHHLPAYRQHHALSDALATAELYLALKADQSDR